MNTYGKLIKYDGEVTMILMEMTGKERDEFFPDWQPVDELENLILPEARRQPEKVWRRLAE